MDLQNYLQQETKKMRDDSFSNSEQLTLGEIIDKLKPLISKQESISKKYDHEATVVFDFEYAFPINFGSWRGSYSELSLSFGFVGYKFESDEKSMGLSEFLKKCEETVGKTFEGWKGGDFTMDRDTPVWVANQGNSGNTGIIDIVDNEYEIILITKYCNF